MEQIKKIGLLLTLITGLGFLSCKKTVGPNVSAEELIGMWLWSLISVSQTVTTTGMYDSIPINQTDRFDTSAVPPEGSSSIEFTPDSNFTVTQDYATMQSLGVGPVPGSGRWWVSGGMLNLEYGDAGGFDTSTIIANVNGNNASFRLTENDSMDLGEFQVRTTTSLTITGQKASN